MSLLDGIKRHFIMIFDHGAHTEPIVIESLPSVLPSQRAGEEDCDVSSPNIQCILYFSKIN